MYVRIARVCYYIYTRLDSRPSSGALFKSQDSPNNVIGNSAFRHHIVYVDQITKVALDLQFTSLLWNDPIVAVESRLLEGMYARILAAGESK